MDLEGNKDLKFGVIEENAGARWTYGSALKRGGYSNVLMERPAFLNRALEFRPDVIILGNKSSSVKPEEVISTIRQDFINPIMLVGQPLDSSGKKLERFIEIGVDRVLAMDRFKEGLFVSYVNALVRRMSFPESELKRFKAGIFINDNLMVDLVKHKVILDGKTLSLSPLEYQVLTLLARNAGEIVNHQTLYSKIWHHQYDEELGCIESLRRVVNRLRIKLGEDFEDQHLVVTKKDRGYKMPILSK